MYFHGQFLLGVLVSIVNIAIQAAATVAAIRTGRVVGRWSTRRQSVRSLILIMAASGTLLTWTHLMQVGVWAIAYLAVGETSLQDTYFLAFVNFTSLGATIPEDHYWRILAPFTAANGMLMFGWSTAVLFAVLSKTIDLLKLR